MALAATVLALVSVWHSFGHVDRRLRTEAKAYAAYTAQERVREPIAAMTLDPAIFDFYRRYVDRGDRIYYQVMPSGFSHDLDLPAAIAAAGRFYLLPAVQVTDLAHATVVISWFADPSELHVKFITQVQAGQQPLWVSRISAP